MTITTWANNTVMAKTETRTYALSFKDEADAKSFMSELSATQEDLSTLGRDHCVRKKYLFANPAEGIVRVNMNTRNSASKKMELTLEPGAETSAFFEDLKVAIFGRMPAI